MLSFSEDTNFAAFFLRTTLARKESFEAGRNLGLGVERGDKLLAAVSVDVGDVDAHVKKPERDCHKYKTMNDHL